MKEKISYTEYQNKIKENYDLVRKLILLKDNYEDARIFLLPNNEYELLIANTVLTYNIDALAIIEASKNGTINESITEDNTAIQLFIHIINLFKENIDALVEPEINNMSSHDKAKLMIDYYTGFASNQDKFLEIIAKNTGFDIEDKLSLLELELYFKKVKNIFSKQRISEAKLIANKDLAQNIISTCTIFHEMAIEKLQTEPKISADIVRKLKKSN
jgi:hypothetical protein